MSGKDRQGFQGREGAALDPRLLQRAVEQAPASVVITDADGTIAWVNPWFCRTTGYSREEALGKTPRILKSDIHPASFYEEMWRTISSGRTWHGELCNRRKDGSLYWEHATISPVLDAEGRVTHYVAVKFDVTARHRAQEELAESERRHRTIVETMMDGLLIVDERGRALFVNPAAARMLGLPAGELIGRDLTEFVRPGHERVIEEERARRRAGLASTYELPIRTATGEDRLFLLSAAPLACRDTDERRTVIVVRDVTEQRREDEELRRAREEAIAASRAKTEFLANVSHEIRTPMNAILGLSALLLDSPLDPEQREHVRDIRAAAEGLLTLIGDILDVSRLEAGRFEFREVAFRPLEVLAEVARILRPRARGKGLHLGTRFDGGEECVLLGDPWRLRQVLINLVGNAVKFTDEGAVQVELRLVPEEGGRCRLRLEVRDTGPGIPPEVGARIYEPFRQANGAPNRRHGGTGLGLAITRRLVELQGGTISHESEPGWGTVFRVEIPYRVGKVEQLRDRETSVAGELAAQPANPLRVLLVEDHPVNAKVAARLLERRGHRVTVVGDGREALEELRREGTAIDVVLMDVQMPGMDGLEATRRIRAGEAGETVRRVPIVALTAHAMREDEERCLAAGMDAYLAKPLDPQALFRAVEGLARVAEMAGDVAGGAGEGGRR